MDGIRITVGAMILALLGLALSGCGGSGASGDNNTPGAIEYTLTISNFGQGQVSPKSGTKFAKDTVLTLTAIPETGYTLDGWFGQNGLEVTGENTLVMDSDKSITAVFVEPAQVGAYEAVHQFITGLNGRNSVLLQESFSTSVEVAGLPNEPSPQSEGQLASTLVNQSWDLSFDVQSICTNPDGTVSVTGTSLGDVFTSAFSEQIGGTMTVMVAKDGETWQITGVSFSDVTRVEHPLISDFVQTFLTGVKNQDYTAILSTLRDSVQMSTEPSADYVSYSREQVASDFVAPTIQVSAGLAGVTWDTFAQTDMYYGDQKSSVNLDSRTIRLVLRWVQEFSFIQTDITTGNSTPMTGFKDGTAYIYLTYDEGWQIYALNFSYCPFVFSETDRQNSGDYIKLVWTGSDVDLDLLVLEPDGSSYGPMDHFTPNGTLGGDAPYNGLTSETYAWLASAQGGNYSYAVESFSDMPVSAIVEISIEGVVSSHPVEVIGYGDWVEFGPVQYGSPGAAVQSIAPMGWPEGSSVKRVK